MPILANAKKALRQREKLTKRNTIAKSEIASLRVKFRKAISAKQWQLAQEVGRLASKKMDKAVSRGVLKRNTAARYKSRLMAKLNSVAKV